jgi:hypothetical protein
MKRQLHPRFDWSPADRELELLEREKNPEAFEKLYQHIRAQLDDWLKDRAPQLNAISEADQRFEVKRVASRFQEKFISLPNYIYLRRKVFVAERLNAHPAKKVPPSA